MPTPSCVDGLGVNLAQGVATTVASSGQNAGARVGWLVVQVVVVVAVLAALAVARHLLWRWWTLRKLIRKHPDRADAIRESARQVPLLRGEKPPKDSMARTHRTVVPPFGDGRPGEAFWGPGPSQPGIAPDGPRGWRQDALVLIAPGTYLLVVCQGRVGDPCSWGVLEPARERVAAARDAATDRVPVGPVDEVPVAGETGWRTTFQTMIGKTLTDTYVDHDGWAFVVGVLSSREHARAVEICDHILATWRWLPAEEPPVG